MNLSKITSPSGYDTGKLRTLGIQNARSLWKIQNLETRNEKELLKGHT